MCLNDHKTHASMCILMSLTHSKDVENFRKEPDESRRLQNEILAKISSTVAEKLVDASSEVQCPLPIEDEPDGKFNSRIVCFIF